MKAISSLRTAAEAATDLGLGGLANEAMHLVAQAETRLGFEGSAYVLALAGGTGVGKSSLLNAFAARKVSEVGVLRPTTAQPVAWVAGEERAEVGPLLDWLGIKDVSVHPQEVLKRVVVIDLPDFDSVAVDHRATVDQLLPRIDAMLWVVDPEKYDDELLYSYLRNLTRHAERIAFVFNKADRLEPVDQRLIREDFSRRLQAAGFSQPAVFMVSALTGEGLNSLLAALKQRANEKELVKEKLEADLAANLRGLASAAGVGERFSPLLDRRDRALATTEAVNGALAIVDPDGVAAQVKAAVLYRARRQGGSLLARILALLSNLTGARRRSADPEGFLLAWRQRGSLGHVLNPIRRVLVDSVSRLPAPARPAVMGKVEFDQLEARMTKAIENGVASSRRGLEPPGSFLWVFLGMLQLLLGAAFLFAVAWYLTILFGPASLLVGEIDVPYLGPVPIPLAILTGSLVLSLVLSFLLTIHASWVGQRRGAKVASQVGTAIENTIESAAFRHLDDVDGARQRISQALSG